MQPSAPLATPRQPVRWPREAQDDMPWDGIDPFMPGGAKSGPPQRCLSRKRRHPTTTTVTDGTGSPTMSMHPARQAYVEEEMGAVRQFAGASRHVTSGQRQGCKSETRGRQRSGREKR